MNLHDHFTDTLDRVDAPDLAGLTAAARSRGTRLRRRRTAGLAVAGVAASAAVLGLVGVAALGGDVARTPVATEPSAPAAVAGPDGPAVPTTPQGIAAGLQWAVAETRVGSASDFRGQGGNEFYSELRWQDADGKGVSVIGINVQFDAAISSCDPARTRQLGCRETTLPDGDRLTTYTETTEVADGTGLRRVADLLHPDGVRVVVSSTNGFDLPSSQWDITRPEPPLSIADLRAVVEQDFWGRTLPQGFVDAGAALPGYQDIGGSFDAQPVESLSP